MPAASSSSQALRGKLPGPLQAAAAAWRQQWQTQWQPRWQAMAARERLGVLLALTALGLLLAWSVLISPALATLRQVPAQQAALDTQLAQMRALAAQTQELRKLPGLPPSQAEAAFKAATERLGANARVHVMGDRATVQLTGVDGATLLGWLGEVRGAARARPIEAQLTRSGSGYSGSVVLSLPSAP